jgi:hypothetical protein
MNRVWAALGLAAWLSIATPVDAQCAGDCDENGTVAVNELVLGVNIALDRASLDGCASLDSDNDSRIAVNELVAAVNNALRGCGVAVVTSTPTPTGTATPTLTTVPSASATGIATTTPISTPTASPTSAPPTATPSPTLTPDTIGGVSTRMLGFFSGTVTVDTQVFPGRLQIQVSDAGIVATDLSTPAPFIFPNPVLMTVVSSTELLYELAGPPLIRFTLTLTPTERVIGRYSYDDAMPPPPIDYDLVREP